MQRSIRDRYRADPLRPEHRDGHSFCGNVSARACVVCAHACRRVPDVRCPSERCARLRDRRIGPRAAGLRCHFLELRRRVLSPGGRPIELASADATASLWLVTNEPELAFERLAPPSAGEALIEATISPLRPSPRSSAAPGRDSRASALRASRCVRSRAARGSSQHLSIAHARDEPARSRRDQVAHGTTRWRYRSRSMAIAATRWSTECARTGNPSSPW